MPGEIRMAFLFAPLRINTYDGIELPVLRT